MQGPTRRELPVLVIRRTLGVALALDVFYLVAALVWDLPPLTAGDVLDILAVVFLGVLLGVGFSYLAPVPERKGLPRVIRTLLLTVPAIGIGIAVQVVLGGPAAERAYFIMFALAAWLGSLFVREEDEGDEADPADETPPEPKGWHAMDREAQAEVEGRREARGGASDADVASSDGPPE